MPFGRGGGGVPKFRWWLRCVSRHSDVSIYRESLLACSNKYALYYHDDLLEALKIDMRTTGFEELSPELQI